MIIFMYILLLYPVTASAVFYNLPPLFTSRPLRPEELAEMMPHTTPKAWTIPFAPLTTAKTAEIYHEEHSGGLFHNSPPLYTSRPLRPEELLQMALHTTPKIRTNPFATLEENYQKQIKTKFTGAIFHTSPPLYTSRPLRPEELIQMVPHKNSNTWTTPFVSFTTTERTVGTYRKQPSTGLSKVTAVFGQPYEDSDELYSPTLWSFGTFMSRNHTPVTEKPASQAYAPQFVTDYVNKLNLTESGTYLGEGHTLRTNLQSADSNLQKGIIDDVTRPQSDGFFGKYHTSGKKASVPEIYTSEPEREPLTKLHEGLVNQLFGSSKSSSSSVKDYTSATNPTTITITTPVEFPTSDSSSSAYQRELMDHVNPIESVTSTDDHALGANVRESFALQKEPSPTQYGSLSGEYYARGTKAPISTTPTSKYETAFSEQTNSAEHVTYAGDDTFAKNQAVSKSTTFRSQKKSTSQFSSNSKHFIGEDYATELPTLETSTLAHQTKSMSQFHPTESDTYAEMYHILGNKAPVLKSSTYKPNSLLDKAHEMSIHGLSTKSFSNIDRGSTSQMSSTESDIYIDEGNTFETNLPGTKISSSKPQEGSIRQFGASKPDSYSGESGAYVNIYHTLVTKLRYSKYHTPSEPNNFFDRDHRGSTKQPVVTIRDPHFDIKHTSVTDVPILKSTSVTYKRTTKTPFVEAHTPKRKNEIINQFNPTEPNSYVAFEANSSVSQTSNSNPRRDSVNKINSSNYVSSIEKHYTPAKNSSIAQILPSNRRATKQPASTTVSPQIGFINHLDYVQLKNGTNILNGETLEPVIPDHFRVTDMPTKFPTAQTAQPQLEDTEHIMPIYNQPADNKVVSMPRLVSRTQQHTLNQGGYRIYNTVTTTALPYYYESTDFNTGSAPLQSESYTGIVPNQNVPKHLASNGDISWLVPQTTYNAPAPGYTWRLSGTNQKLSNFDNLQGNFGVSSARNEIKLIYRPNVPVEEAPRSGSTHYETVENPDGGKTHKLVLYV